MSKELLEILQRYESGELSGREEQALLVYLMNNEERYAQRYTTRINTLIELGALLFDTSSKRWSVAQVPALAPKKKGGRPKSTRELVAVSIYVDKETLEALDRIVGYTNFSRSAYIDFIIKRYLKDRKEL